MFLFRADADLFAMPSVRGREQCTTAPNVFVFGSAGGSSPDNLTDQEKKTPDELALQQTRTMLSKAGQHAHTFRQQ